MSFIDISDRITITSRSVVGMDEGGIVYRKLNGPERIDFASCARNYALLHGGDGICIGCADRSGSNHSVDFYTSPFITEIFFMDEQTMNADLETMIAAVEKRGYTLRENPE